MPSMPPLGEGSSLTSGKLVHPFQNSTGKLIVLPNDIDVEEESRLYDEICDVLFPTPCFNQLAILLKVASLSFYPGRSRLCRPTIPQLVCSSIHVLQRHLARRQLGRKSGVRARRQDKRVDECGRQQERWCIRRCVDLLFILT
jgi:hypothetical protein